MSCLVRSPETTHTSLFGDVEENPCGVSPCSSANVIDDRVWTLLAYPRDPDSSF